MNILKKIIAVEAAFLAFAVLVGPLNAWLYQVSYREGIFNVFSNINLIVVLGFVLYWLFVWAFDL